VLGRAAWFLGQPSAAIFRLCSTTNLVQLPAPSPDRERNQHTTPLCCCLGKSCALQAILMGRVKSRGRFIAISSGGLLGPRLTGDQHPRLVHRQISCVAGDHENGPSPSCSIARSTGCLIFWPLLCPARKLGRVRTQTDGRFRLSPAKQFSRRLRHPRDPLAPRFGRKAPRAKLVARRAG